MKENDNSVNSVWDLHCSLPLHIISLNREQWPVEKMSRSEIERSRALQRSFLVVANSLAALAAICTVSIFFSSIFTATFHLWLCFLHTLSDSNISCSPTITALLKVCVGVWSLTSESFLLPLVPDTLLISSAYIQVSSLDGQMLVPDDTGAFTHIIHKALQILDFCDQTYSGQCWGTNCCHWMYLWGFASFPEKDHKHLIGQGSRIFQIGM